MNLKYLLLLFLPMSALAQPIQRQFGTTNDAPTLTNIIKSLVPNPLTNTYYASNALSGGQFPLGTVSTGLTAVAGPFLTTNGAARSYSYNAGGLTNLTAGNLNGIVPSPNLAGNSGFVGAFLKASSGVNKIWTQDGSTLTNLSGSDITNDLTGASALNAVQLVGTLPAASLPGSVLTNNYSATISLSNSSVSAAVLKVYGSNSPSAFNVNMDSSSSDGLGGADNVFSMGWNTAPGGGPLVAGEPELGFKFERSFTPGNFELYVETTMANGLIGRPWSWVISRTNAGANYQVTSPNIAFADGYVTNSPTATNYMTMAGHQITTFSTLVASGNVANNANVTNVSGSMSEFKGGSVQDFYDAQGSGVVRMRITNGIPSFAFLNDGTLYRLEATNVSGVGNTLGYAGAGIQATKFFPASFGSENGNTFLSANTWQVKNAAGTYQTAFINASSAEFGNGAAGNIHGGSTGWDLGASSAQWGKAYVTNLIDAGSMSFNTNQATMAPNFSLMAQDITTNAAFTFLAPIGVNQNYFERCMVFVTNSTAAAVLATMPANVHGYGTPYVTNLTKFTFEHYGKVYTNCNAEPIF